MHFKSKTILTLLLLALAVVAAFGAGPDDLLNSLKPQGAVSDFAGVIDASSRKTIVNLTTELRNKTGASIAVVTLNSLEGGAIDDFANRLFGKWGIGDKRKDNGLLILAAIEDRQYRIEVGYGLEGAIPDSVAGRIGRDILAPNFRQSKYGAGLTAAAAVLADRIAREQGATLTGVPRDVRDYAARIDAKKGIGSKIGEIIFFLIIAIIFIRNPFLALLLLSGGRGGGFRGGGFGGGGGGGFGGGMSGGGGASGGW